MLKFVSAFCPVAWFGNEVVCGADEAFEGVVFVVAVDKSEGSN